MADFPEGVDLGWMNAGIISRAFVIHQMQTYPHESRNIRKKSRHVGGEKQSTKVHT
jgi:hypothetical protein